MYVWLTCTCSVALSSAIYMVYLIERAKKCLDFSATVYIIHLFICIMYGGWPSSITWWVVNATGIAVMALLGEFLCIRRELREIPITRYRSSKQTPYLNMFFTDFLIKPCISILIAWVFFVVSWTCIQTMLVKIPQFVCYVCWCLGSAFH